MLVGRGWKQIQLSLVGVLCGGGIRRTFVEKHDITKEFEMTAWQDLSEGLTVPSTCVGYDGLKGIERKSRNRV